MCPEPNPKGQFSGHKPTGWHALQDGQLPIEPRADEMTGPLMVGECQNLMFVNPELIRMALFGTLLAFSQVSCDSKKIFTKDLDDLCKDLALLCMHPNWAHLNLETSCLD